MRPTCKRCGDDLPCVEATTYGDTEPKFVPAGACECPGPRCPFCGARLDHDDKAAKSGECPNRECFMWCRLIPLPDVA